jgi:hypothetical protein
MSSCLIKLYYIKRDFFGKIPSPDSSVFFYSFSKEKIKRIAGNNKKIKDL